jgi:hypothetical protein
VSPCSRARPRAAWEAPPPGGPWRRWWARPWEAGFTQRKYQFADEDKHGYSRTNRGTVGTGTGNEGSGTASPRSQRSNEPAILALILRARTLEASEILRVLSCLSPLDEPSVTG